MPIEWPILVFGALAIDATRDPSMEPPDESEGAIEMDAPSARGRVLPLTAEQRRNRWLYLAGELTGDALDPFVRAPLRICPPIYYRLKDHNGGKDPTAPDCATRWTSPGGSAIHVTSDCMGAAAWAGGFDRFQPARFAHIYGGWINTDSMIADATGQARCFRRIERPENGCFIVCASGAGGQAIGHIGGVVNAERFSDRDWSSLGVVDVAARGAGIRANRRTTGAGWQARDGMFVVPILKP